MPTLRLTLEQAEQLEQVLHDALAAAQGDEVEELRALYARLVKTKETVQPLDVGLAKCAACGREFMRSPRRRQAIYCSPKCSAKAYRQRRLQRERAANL